MGRKSRPTFKKRQKEIARQQRSRDKMTRRMAKKDEEPETPPIVGEEDPDIAGVRPGPQPLPDEWSYVPQSTQAAPKPEPKTDEKPEQQAENDS